MSSPVHRILFSPPSSPPSYAVGSSEDIDPLSTLRDLLLPIARSPATIRSTSPKISSPLASSSTHAVTSVGPGPGGFNSTSGYPSRYSYSGGPRRSSTQAGPERRGSASPYSSPNPFDMIVISDEKTSGSSSSKEQYRGDGLHRRSSSNAGVLPVHYASQQTSGRSWGVGNAPRRTLRLVLLLVSILAGLYILTSSSVSPLSKPASSVAEDGTLSPAAMREHLLAMQSGASSQDNASIRSKSKSASYAVGGKKVVVRPGGAPSRIYAGSRPGVASGESEGDAETYHGEPRLTGIRKIWTHRIPL
jgi:hypothetical protein